MDHSVSDILQPVLFLTLVQNTPVTSYVQRVSLLRAYKGPFFSTAQEKSTYYQNTEYNKAKQTLPLVRLHSNSAVLVQHITMTG